MSAPVPMRVPWVTIYAWAQSFDMSREEFDFLDACIRELDAVFLANYKQTKGSNPDDKLSRWDNAET